MYDVPNFNQRNLKTLQTFNPNCTIHLIQLVYVVVHFHKLFSLPLRNHWKPQLTTKKSKEIKKKKKKHERNIRTIHSNTLFTLNRLFNSSLLVCFYFHFFKFNFVSNLSILRLVNFLKIKYLRIKFVILKVKKNHINIILKNVI